MSPKDSQSSLPESVRCALCSVNGRAKETELFRPLELRKLLFWSILWILDMPASRALDQVLDICIFPAPPKYISVENFTSFYIVLMFMFRQGKVVSLDTLPHPTPLLRTLGFVFWVS